MRTRFIVLGIVLASASCARAKPVGTPPTSRQQPFQKQTTMMVENRNFQDVVIWVIHDGIRSRLGTVTATSSASFVMKSEVLRQAGTLQFAAHAVGEGRRIFVSDPIGVQPGQRVEWVLESGFERSALTVQ